MASAAEWSTRKAWRLVIDWKESQPCVGCGLYYRYFQVEANHVRGEKKFNLGAREARNLSERELRDELGKCEVLCRNCHALYGWSRVRGFRLHDFVPRFRGFPPGASPARWTAAGKFATEALARRCAHSAKQKSSRNLDLSAQKANVGGQGNEHQAIRRLLH